MSLFFGRKKKALLEQSVDFRVGEPYIDLKEVRLWRTSTEIKCCRPYRPLARLTVPTCWHSWRAQYLSNYLVFHRLFAFRVGKRQPTEEASRLLDSETCPTVTRTLSERPAIPISSTTQRPKLNELMKQMVEKERYARAHLKKNVKPTTKSTPDWDSPTPELFEDVPF